MFNKSWSDSKFDKEFNRMQRFIKGWFVFVALLALTLLGGGAYLLVRILLHFGIL
jgi:hypothetical protein